jgi:predicted O-methyltransferase YrrM
MLGIRNPFAKPVVSWHVTFIKHLAEVLNPSSYAELGIYEGETFNLIQANSKIAVDINPKSLQFVRDAQGVTKICGDSTVLKEYLKVNNTFLDLLFIDADHRKESVIEDFSNIESHMSENGVLLFHDTYPGTEEMSSPNYCGDGFLAIPELREKYKGWNFITLPIHPGLTIATRTNHLPKWVKSLAD